MLRILLTIIVNKYNYPSTLLEKIKTLWILKKYILNNIKKIDYI